MADRMTLTADDLNPTDRQILELLREGRCTPSYMASETGYAKGSVRNRLRRLVEHGHVQKPHKGLYALADDPERDAREAIEYRAVDDQKTVSYGPSSEIEDGFVLTVVTEDSGRVSIHLGEDAMYGLWTEVQHTPWPDRTEEQEEAGELRQKLVDLAQGADADMLRDALDALDPHWQER